MSVRHWACLSWYARDGGGNLRARVAWKPTYKANVNHAFSSVFGDADYVGLPPIAFLVLRPQLEIDADIHRTFGSDTPGCRRLAAWAVPIPRWDLA